jgi:DNA-binding response OmpR family regulator
LRLLIVEDEPDLANAIARGLRRDGHAVDTALTAGDADIKLRSADYDLVCLDWSLPDGSGIGLCRDLVSGALPTLEGERPRILMLTARDGVEDRVTGLDSGADDYLVKPFALAELSARVRALLRREGQTEPVIEVGPLRLDPARFLVSRDGRPLDLTAKEFSLLHYFMAHAGHVLSQEHLLEHVWDEMADPMTNVVRVTVSNLRKKLGEPPLITTVPGRGYRLEN